MMISGQRRSACKTGIWETSGCFTSHRWEVTDRNPTSQELTINSRLFYGAGKVALLSLIPVPMDDGRDEFQTGSLTFRIQVEDDGRGSVTQKVSGF
jgi:hypothetical protein